MVYDDEDALSPDETGGDDADTLFARLTADVQPLVHRKHHSLPDAPLPQDRRHTSDVSVPSSWKVPVLPIAEDLPPPAAMAPRQRRHLKKGRIEVEATLDLHHCTQEAAQRRLEGFLHRARARGYRYVCIITGRGKKGEGVLRRMLPHWLATPPLTGLVISIAPAPSDKGGEGAFILHLRR